MNSLQQLSSISNGAIHASSAADRRSVGFYILNSYFLLGSSIFPSSHRSSSCSIMSFM